MTNRLHPSPRPALLAISVLAATILLAVLGAAQNGPPPSMEGKTAAQQFKNIRVLKKLPADRLIPMMQNFDASLGVGCDFCHAGRDRASDAKPTKNVARQMILMTENIKAHQKILDHKATCYMCHHGHESPETSAPPPGPR